jgi:hypothetical protein
LPCTRGNCKCHIGGPIMVALLTLQHLFSMLLYTRQSRMWNRQDTYCFHRDAPREAERDKSWRLKAVDSPV